MDDRDRQIRGFLNKTDWAGAQIRPLAGDASARRYFRLACGDRTLVLMDAPGQSQDIGPFLRVAGFLKHRGLGAPEIIASDRDAGFILMEDLGDDLFARLVAADPGSETLLYRAAVDVLVDLDSAPVPHFVPGFGPVLMCEQVAPAYEWYRLGITGDAGRSEFQQFQGGLETLFARHVSEPPCLLLRDYHAENLIWLPDRDGLRRVGLLDFQDAMAGPPGYDLVSLLQDARRDVSPELAGAMTDRFITRTGRDRDLFAASYAVIGAQRNLRILGVFARLCMMHGKARYVDFIPRVWGYAQDCLAHPGLDPVREMVNRHLPEPSVANLNKLKAQCRIDPIQ